MSFLGHHYIKKLKFKNRREMGVIEFKIKQWGELTVNIL